MNTLTPKEVAALVARAKADPTPGYVLRQGLRTLVHEALHLKNPTPFTDVTPEMQAARERRTPLSHHEKALHIAHFISQLTPEHHEAFGKAKAAGDLDATTACADALHYHQKLHGKALWEETDKLVTAAIGA